jgi:hypothetical protein
MKIMTINPTGSDNMKQQGWLSKRLFHRLKKQQPLPVRRTLDFGGGGANQYDEISMLQMSSALSQWWSASSTRKGAEGSREATVTGKASDSTVGRAMMVPIIMGVTEQCCLDEANHSNTLDAGQGAKYAFIAGHPLGR